MEKKIVKVESFMEMIMARQEGLGSVFYTSAIVVYCVEKTPLPQL